MLVEINLLPEREPRKFTFVIILSSLIFLILIVSGFYFWQIHSTKTNIASVDRQISMTKKIVDRETSKSTTTLPTNSVGQLESAIKWAKDYPIQTIPVMRSLTALLPERGFIQSFGYTEAGTVTLTVQFDNTREAAYFLNSLNNTKWIQDASLNSLTASAAADSNATGTATNTTGNSSTLSNQTTTGQTASTAAGAGTAGVTSNQPDTTNGTAVTGTTSSQTIVSGNIAGQTTSTTIGQTNQTGTAAQTAATDTNKYLPRYIGQFEITLNKNEVKKRNEKGVTGS